MYLKHLCIPGIEGGFLLFLICWLYLSIFVWLWVHGSCISLNYFLQTSQSSFHWFCLQVRIFILIQGFPSDFSLELRILYSVINGLVFWWIKGPYTNMFFTLVVGKVDTLLRDPVQWIVQITDKKVRFVMMHCV